ncbi:pyrroloquinoline quinone biosynthesis peptide chaperone PqqD [Rhodoferax ferrireducens]|uniref:pyrroloquinoline quinone biosynthesis peptide chaperone PqqD n=1 Tax=Rhodoferax ferrireducens TaxID=192843 RepID=UPI000E0D28E5|nr:pyrroloquinoline quinone biosynthesis peptide chaperone PqqD [Rhodoferax ferrireducens]
MDVPPPTQELPVPSGAARPKLNRMFRLQWEEVQQAHVLLYPEGMVQLNASAAEIIRRCDGQTTVDVLVADLEAAFQQPGLRSQIEQLLAQAYARRWLV